MSKVLSLSIHVCAKEVSKLPTVANDGCADIGFRGKWTEKLGPPVLLPSREGASDMQPHVGRQLLDYVPHQEKLEQMLRDLIEAAEKWDVAPKLASLWWTSTYEEEERSEVPVATTGLMYNFPCEEKFKILGCAMNSQGTTLDAIEERMQSANKANWRDILVYRSKDVPWRIKCGRLVDHVYSVFSFGSELWSLSIQTMDRIKRWETKIMMRLFRFKRGKDETWVGYRTRCCKAARKIWIQMGLSVLYDIIAESMWRDMGWVCYQRPDTVVASLQQVFRWRSSQWWHTAQTEGMRDDPLNHTGWKHKWNWHNRGNVWDNMSSDWAGEEDWISKRLDKTSSADKKEFVIRVLNRMNLSTVHRKVKVKEKRKGKTSWLKTVERTGGP